jgi:hypothetical protein
MIPTVVTALRDHLVAAGIGRDSDTPGPLPPIIRDPKLGVPAPGEGLAAGADAVICLYRTGGIPPRRFERERRTPVVQVTLRVRKAPMAETIGEQIEAAILDRRNWLMGAPGSQLRVIESQQVSPLSLITADSQAFDYRMTFSFELYRDPVVAVP